MLCCVCRVDYLHSGCSPRPNSNSGCSRIFPALCDVGIDRSRARLYPYHINVSDPSHTHRVAAQAMFRSAHGTSLERLHSDIELIVVVGIAIGSVDVCWREVFWLHMCRYMYLQVRVLYYLPVPAPPVGTRAAPLPLAPRHTTAITYIHVCE